MNHNKFSFLFLFFLILISCQYFNTFFNAETSFDDAIEEITKANALLSDRATVFSYADEAIIPPAAQKNLEISIKQAWKVIEFYTDSADYADDAFFLIGRANFFLKDYQKSRENFSDLIDNYPESEYWQESWLWLSDSYLALEDTAKALNTLELATMKSLESEYEIKVLTRKGAIAIEKNQYELAVNHYLEALDIAEDDYLVIAIRLLLAHSFYEIADYDNALLNATIAYEEDVDDELTRRALRRIILSYIAKKDFIYTLKWIEEGRSDFDNLPDFGWYELQRGVLFLERGNWTEAKEQWLNVISDYPRTYDAAEAAYNISEYYRTEIGNYDSAYTYILMISSSVIAHDKIKVDHLNKWKAKLKETVDLISKIEIDSLIVSIANEDSAFYYNPENFQFLIQEAQIQLEEKKKALVASNASSSQNDDFQVRRAPATNTNVDQSSIEEFLNTDSLMSVLNQLKEFDKDSMNLSYNDSVTVDSLSRLSTTIQKSLFTSSQIRYNSMDAVMKDYKESLFQLAELLLIDYEDYLSAQVYYREYLNIFKDDTTRSDRALFALGFVDWINGRDAKKIKYFNQILELYPNSPSAKKVYKLQGIEFIDEKSIALKQFNIKYHHAQNLYYNGKVDSSLAILAELQDEAPTANLKAKVILMESMIYKENKRDVDSLLSKYGLLASAYGETEYYKYVKSEHLAIVSYLKSIDTIKTVTTDSLADSTFVATLVYDTTAAAIDTLSAALSDTITQIALEADSTENEMGERIELEKRIDKKVQENKIEDTDTEKENLEIDRDVD